MKQIAFVFVLLCLAASPARSKDRVTTFHDGSLQVELPDGWRESKQNQAGSDSVGGWESSDRKTSFYVLEMRVVNQAADARAALDQTIENFDRDENWLVQSIGDKRDITINGLPAVYVAVELELRAGERKVPFKFHFAMVGAARSFYLLQGSLMKPVWQVREDELIRMFKSFRVLKED